MRILLVSHNFPPAHAAGTESYTAELGLELQRRGHALHVFTAEKDVAQSDFDVREREWRGLPVTEIVNNLYHEHFRDTFANAAVERRFAELLERERPQIVHFQHLLYLSIGCVEQAARHGSAVLFTLHDYWLQCARFGQRVHADRSLCDTIDFARCGECLTSFKWAQTPLERTTGRWLARVRAATGLDLSNTAKRVATVARGDARPADATNIDRELAAELARSVAERDAAMRERVLPHVRRFLAPSRFLRERFIEWGVPPERIEFLRTGADRVATSNASRTRVAGSGAVLRVAFIGTLAPHKGAHVLLEAWSRLPASVRERARLELLGPSPRDPAYEHQLARLAAHCGATLRGAVPRETVAAELPELDLLVVPSTWWENAPLVILEAVAARTPVLASNLGGMAELVGDYDCGETFAPGDVGELGRALERLLSHPSALASFYVHTPPLPTFAEHVTRVEQLYAQVRTSAGLG